MSKTLHSVQGINLTLNWLEKNGLTASLYVILRARKLKKKRAQFQMCFSFPFSIWVGWTEFLFKQYLEIVIAFTTDLGIKEYKVMVFVKYQTIPFTYFWKKAPTWFANPVLSLKDF